MKLCYLINQYPKASHSFIRREILELEAQGASVLRLALRGWRDRPVDPLDVIEQGRTRYLLRSGATGLPLAMLAQVLAHPLRFLRALGETFALARRSDRSFFLHLVSFAEACRAANWMRAAGIAHMHAHFGTNSAEVALLAAMLAGIPFSFTVHGPEEFDHPEGLCLPEKIHRAASVIAISSYGRSQLCRWVDLPQWRKISIVHCGLDSDFLGVEATAPAVSNTLVCVGRLCEQKGQLLLLEALRKVLDRGYDCRLVLAGDGEMRTIVERQIAALGLDEHVVITGWIDSARVKQEIVSARALVLPSFAEGLPVVLMEALALSRPVISTYVAGIPELVRDGECGWLVPAGDVEELSGAMIECLEASPSALAALGENGRSRVLESHDIRVEAAKLLGLFKGSRGDLNV